MKFVFTGCFPPEGVNGDWVARVSEIDYYAHKKLDELHMTLESLYYVLGGTFHFAGAIDAPSAGAMLAFQSWFIESGFGTLNSNVAFDRGEAMAALRNA